MKNVFFRALCAVAVIGVFVVAAPAGAQCVSFTGAPYSQDFDTLANTGTANALALSGWYLNETGGGARDNEQYAADTGASNTGDTYSYGAASATERALGSLQSGSLIATYGACFVNDTGSTVTALNIGYTGEEWRLGTTARTDELDFSYSTDATSLTTGTWNAVTALNFLTPDTGTTGAKNGNAVGERTALTSTLSSLSIANGATFWIRWNDFNASGADDGLAVDDFSLALALPMLSVNDVSVFEGNSGTKLLSFVVSMSSTSPTDVTFDVATSDGTATLADSDYVAIPTTQYTIPIGSTSVGVDVTVNGDATVEADESFTVSLSGVSVNALVLDGLGVGTIKNDDGTPVLTVGDVSATEGDVGTKSFTFTASLSFPAPVGGVTFDVATADGTATTADSDYAGITTTPYSIGAGGLSTTIDVTVNGDLTVEPDETFTVNLTSVVNATPASLSATGTILNDDATPTLIHAIQGSGAVSPMAGSGVTIDGIVVGSFQGTNGLSGFYVQEEDADKDVDPLTSEGIFVFNTTTVVAVGDRVRVAGTVLEFGGLTEISPSTSVSILSSGNPLPEAVEPPVPAPTDPATDWERFEGMLVSFTQPLYVTDSYYMATYGEIGLSAGAKRPQPTNFIDPNDNPASGTSYSGASNVAAIVTQNTLNTNNLITLDDGRNGTNLSPETWNPAGGTIRLGNTVTALTGVMTYQFNLYMVEPTAMPTFNPVNPRTATPPSVGSPVVKAGFQNTLNFFANTGTGRGAANATEFTRQRDKLVAALSGLGADVIGLSELEKDPTAIDSGKPDNAAAQSLAAGLTSVTGNTWAATTDPWTCETDGAPWPCNLGTDPDIKCGIVYDTTKVTPVGASFTDLVAPLGTYSRAPYAQVFSINATGGTFALVVNHFRSKSCSGATGGEADQGDGQACYNLRRTNQALATSAFISSTIVPTTPSVLVVGDLNAYSQEDPVDAFRANGFTDLVEQYQGVETSYSFSGLSGRIDHALATSSLASYVTGASEWHINADEPIVTDYVMTGKPADAPYSPDAYRSSDHDPVLVGMTVPAMATVSGDATICVGSSTDISVVLTGTGPWDVTWSDIGLVSYGSSPVTRTVSPGATITYSVTAVSDSIRAGTVFGSATVTVTSGIPTAASEATLCQGETIHLTATTVSGATYSWTGPNGFTDTAQNPTIPNAQPAASGTYNVTATVGACTSPAGTTTTTVTADSTGPTVTVPAGIAVNQTVCCGTFGGVMASDAAVAAFLTGATATDDCVATSTQLAPQIGAVDVIPSTCFEVGDNTVTFRFQDAALNTGTGTAIVTVRMFGDLNLDGGIDAGDMVVLRAFVNGVILPGTPPFNAPQELADMSHDAVEDAGDMLVLRAFINGAITCMAP